MVAMLDFTEIEGKKINQLVSEGKLKQEKLDQIIERTKKGGAEIVKFLEKGSAFYAPAASGVEMAECFLKDLKKQLPCAAYLNGKYNTKNLYAGVPVIIGADGVEKVIELNLNEQEKKNFENSIMYLHVLEHIKNDLKEIKDATNKLNNGGHLIIIAPAYQKLYGNLDKAVGHFRRYEKKFFKKDFQNLELLKVKHLDSIGLLLYYLNKIFFSKETFPSALKIFIWDKIFTPLTIVIDFIINYSFGKCLVAIYKKK